MSQPKKDTTDTQRGIPRLTERRYELLRPKRRRIAYNVLTGRIPPVDLDDLAAAVAARESNPDAADEEFIECVAISLHHNHLPKMSDLGVDYNPNATRIESCPSHSTT